MEAHLRGARWDAPFFCQGELKRAPHAHTHSLLSAEGFDGVDAGYAARW